MNTAKLSEAMEQLEADLGPGLVSSDIWGPDGLSIVGHDPRPQAVALFADLSARVRQALETAGFPTLGRYYFLDLENHKAVCVMLCRDHQWGCLVDLRYIVMAKLITRALPKALQGLQDALDS